MQGNTAETEEVGVTDAMGMVKVQDTLHWRIPRKVTGGSIYVKMAIQGNTVLDGFLRYRKSNLFSYWPESQSGEDCIKVVYKEGNVKLNHFSHWFGSELEDSQLKIVSVRSNVKLHLFSHWSQ